MLAVVRKTSNFPVYLNQFLKFCKRNFYIMNDALDSKKLIKRRLRDFIKSRVVTADVNDYMLRHYHAELWKELNKESRTVEKYKRKNLSVPAYIVEFNDFKRELEVYFS
jgi:hypothetical protein